MRKVAATGTLPRALVCLALFAVLALACGTARFDIKTTVLSPDEMEQQLVVQGEGMFGDALRQAMNEENLGREGWQLETRSLGNTQIMTLTKRVKPGESISPPTPRGQQSLVTADPKPEFRVSEHLFHREYELRLTMPGMTAPAPTATPTRAPSATATRVVGSLNVATPRPLPTIAPFNSDQFGRLGEQLAEQMLRSVRISWTVTLPGEIVETNADSKTQNSGTWELGYDQMKSGIDMRITSRERKPLNLAGGGVAGLLLIGGAGYVVYRRRTASSPAAEIG